MRVRPDSGACRQPPRRMPCAASFACRLHGQWRGNRSAASSQPSGRRKAIASPIDVGNFLRRRQQSARPVTASRSRGRSRRPRPRCRSGSLRPPAESDAAAAVTPAGRGTPSHPTRSALVEETFGKAEGWPLADPRSVHAGPRHGKIGTAPVVVGCRLGPWHGCGPACRRGGTSLRSADLCGTWGGANASRDATTRPTRRAADTDGRAERSQTLRTPAVVSRRRAARFSIPVDWGVHR